MGALEAPQDRHGQEHRTGTSRAEQTGQRPWRSWELRRPWQVVLVAVASSLSLATPAVTLLPPLPQNLHGAATGYQEPSGARQTGTGSPPGLAWKLRLLLGMT